ncbi:uncharacterized protein LOC119737262 [Patiria miniata]|uniref:Fibronectin type-III domain-containing protein n=1 Tax=Patiria miniata TaxID=46514 RepID=A0A914AV75_PATMI|nr:uncharacterized protein LOC119737262 [Patiria miniata]
MMGVRLPNWTQAVLFVWCCFAAPLIPNRSLSTGLLVAEGLERNSTNTSFPPEPASDFSCFSFDFLRVTCEWTRGGQGHDVSSNDVLMYRGGGIWTECGYFKLIPKCNSTHHCKQECSSCTRCEYRIQTTNDLGLTAYSEEVVFNVYKDSRVKPPRDLTVTNQSFSELLVNWRPPDPLPTYIKYTLEYRWEGSSADDSWRRKEDIERVSYTLGDLEHAYGLYYVRVKALKDTYTPTIESVFTEVARGRTTEKAPIDLPEHFLCVDAPNQKNDTRHVHLSWKPLQNKFKLNGEILGYVITYSSSEAGLPTRLDAGVNDTNYTVYDLKKDHHYSFSIQARNSMGTSSKKASCSKINPVPVAPSPVGPVIGVCITIVIVIIFLIVICCRVKKSIRKFPAIKLPSQLQEDNEYLSEHRNRGAVREVEVFDEVKPCQLFVDLGPKQTNVIDIFDDMPVITDGFHIGDKPRGAVGFQNDIIDLDSLPLLGLKGELMLDDIASATEPLLPGSRRDEDPSSGDEYGGALPSSPVSVGSGGSYLGIRDDDDMVYSCMTKEGLSPVEKENTEGQRVLGERPPDSAPRPRVDGLPLLQWRRESVESDEDNLQDGDAVDSYTKMSTFPSRRENSHAAAGPVRKDPQADRPSTHGAMHSKGAKHPKASSKAIKSKGADLAGATHAGDGSISDYVQQGFVPGAAAQGDGDYDPGDPADSYSRLGLLEGPRAASSPHGISLDNSNQDSAVPSGNRGGDDETLAEPTIGQDSRTEDSSNPLIGRTSAAASGAVVPLSQLGSEPRPTNEVLGIPNVARAQSLDSLSDDDDEEGGLTYVTVALDSDNDESVNGTEQADMNGYVTQAMMPNNWDAPTARTVSNDTVNNAAPSGYVDQAQLSNFSPPSFARPPVHSNPVQMNGSAGSGSGYVTAAEARDIMSPGPDGGPVNENFTNNNNNNGRTENDAQDSIPSHDDSGLDEDRGFVARQQATEMLAARPNGATDTRDIDGLAPTQPAGPGYVTTDQLASLPLPRPQANGHVNGHHMDPDSGDYVTQDEMLHMAEASRNQSAKNANRHVGKESGEQTD